MHQTTGPFCVLTNQRFGLRQNKHCKFFSQVTYQDLHFFSDHLYVFCVLKFLFVFLNIVYIYHHFSKVRNIWDFPFFASFPPPLKPVLSFQFRVIIFLSWCIIATLRSFFSSILFHFLVLFSYLTVVYCQIAS